VIEKMMNQHIYAQLLELRSAL
jgi:hypothetical protein